MCVCYSLYFLLGTLPRNYIFNQKRLLQNTLIILLLFFNLKKILHRTTSVRAPLPLQTATRLISHPQCQCTRHTVYPSSRACHVRRSATCHAKSAVTATLVRWFAVMWVMNYARANSFSANTICPCQVTPGFWQQQHLFGISGDNQNDAAVAFWGHCGIRSIRSFLIIMTTTTTILKEYPLTASITLLCM